ncbi:MAG: amidase [Balneolaceae bacterium]|nr:amidase [Balneolaceae bacterium]
MTKRLTHLLVGISIGTLLTLGAFHLLDDREITPETVRQTSRVLGLEFTDGEIDAMIGTLENNREDYVDLRELSIPNGLPPALIFDPVPAGKSFDRTQEPIDWEIPGDVPLPDDRSELAFYSVRELASLVRSRKISSEELTRFFLDRLRTYGDTLEAVITLTEERALEQARRMDRELAQGNWRGPLHGIPYGAKDLFAVEDYPTTWGAEPYRDQTLDHTATVINKLDEAGAVLVAKTTLGALAYGDVWFGGQTRSPWNLEQGSSGSSAGSAAGTSAGLLPFALGTETLGSIVSPAHRNGTTGLRPTFGRVSRHGAMALSWSMDKVGPLTRSVEDAAIVFDAIRGPDGRDRTLYDLPFNYKRSVDLSSLRIGYLDVDDYSHRDSLTLAKLRELGAELVPVQLPDVPARNISFILSTEAAAAFDDLTRSGADDEMVRQSPGAWPNTFRAHRFVPAVEYIQANRLRTRLIEKMDSVMQHVDVYVSPTYGGSNLLVTNLTGHPSVVLPNGFDDDGEPASITFVGRLFGEADLLGVAKTYQEATDFHTRHPQMFR